MTPNTRVPDEAVKAVAKAIEARCCSFSDGDGSLGSGWADQEYLRVANEVLDTAHDDLRDHFYKAFSEAIEGMVEREELDSQDCGLVVSVGSIEEVLEFIQSGGGGGG